MTINDYIKKLEEICVIPNEPKMMNWWGKSARSDGSWYDFEVNFYTLLVDEPLWKFNELYNKWYKKQEEDGGYKCGPMGDFLEDEPTDEQIEDFINGKEIKF